MLPVTIYPFSSMAKEKDHRLIPMPGLLSLMTEFDNAKIPMSVVTNACRKNAEFMLETLGISERFKHLIIGDECVKGKPHPEPYLQGLLRHSCEARFALAFEGMTPYVSV